MSRIGKMPIKVPTGVQVNIAPNNVVSVKGPKGQLNQTVDPDIRVSIDGNNEVIVDRPEGSNQKRHRALHGLYRALLANMVKGVSEGYTLKMEVVGVGYRATHSGSQLELTVGYSHPVLVILPKEVKVTTVTEKGQAPVILLESADKELLGLVAAKIRSVRGPEPYKGKGIRFAGEVLRRKAGKTASK